MKLLITIEVDQEEDHCDAVLEELEASAAEAEIITIRTGAGVIDVALLTVREVAAVGREPGQPTLPFDGV